VSLLVTRSVILAPRATLRIADQISFRDMVGPCVGDVWPCYGDVRSGGFPKQKMPPLVLAEPAGQYFDDRQIWGERRMPDFRCFFMDERGHILFPADITAADLEIAKRHAFGILEDRASGDSEEFSRSIAALEIWQGEHRLFRS
jgi:hypothetical protein